MLLDWKAKGEDYKKYKTDWMRKDRQKPGVREKRNFILKERRHRLGISKKYREEYVGLSKTKEYKRLSNQAYKRRVRIGGKLSIHTIQQVYEDNIKQYGTLTCYLCLQPIEFGKDTLEHKIPLVRGGTNVYNNLAISCQRCNYRKHDKTEIEYREGISLCK